MVFRLRRSRLKVTGATVGQLASESVAIGSTVVDEYLQVWLCSELVSCAQVQESVSQACSHLGRQDRAEQVPQELPTTIPHKTVHLWSMRSKSLWQAALMPEL